MDIKIPTRELTKPQLQIFKDPRRFRVVNCGRRFGKTTLAIEAILAKAILGKNQKIAYIANTYQQARDICWRELKTICIPITFQANEARLEIEIHNNHGGTSLIWLRGWESVETLRGQGFHLVVIDEVATMRNFWINYHEVIRPALSDTKGEVLFLSTPKGYNHFYDLYQLYKTDSDFKSFHFTTADNPLIPEDELLKARQELTNDRYAQEYLADFRKVEGLVYPEFVREAHIVDVVPTYRKERLLFVDFGYTNPTAVLVCDVDQTDTYWIVEEWYRTGKTNIEIIEYCKSKLSNSVYPDPAEPDRIEEMRRHGLNIREVTKDIEAGVNKVREMFKANKIKIHKSCINLVTELESYVYPDKKDQHNPDEAPIKENDHAVDALRYGISMHSVSGTKTLAHQYKPNYGRT